MKTTTHSVGLAFFAAGLFNCVSAFATDCAKVAAQVRTAIEQDPAKVLVIVEDAMVANESCACEIVKAALNSSNANTDLARQIVLTATNVAPNLANLIAECARGVVVARGGKEVKQVMDIQPVPSEPAAGPDYRTAPADIRGVYLIQPAAGGVVLKECCNDEPTTKTKVVRVVKRTPPKECEPQSPSTATASH